MSTSTPRAPCSLLTSKGKQMNIDFASPSSNTNFPTDMTIPKLVGVTAMRFKNEAPGRANATEASANHVHCDLPRQFNGLHSLVELFVWFLDYSEHMRDGSKIGPGHSPALVRSWRVLDALHDRPLSREAVDRIAGCSNGPGLIKRMRASYALELPCELELTLDRDDFSTRRGVYRLSEADLQQVGRAALLASSQRLKLSAAVETWIRWRAA